MKPYEVIPQGHSDPLLNSSPRLYHGLRLAGRLPERGWELLSWGARKRVSLWDHGCVFSDFLWLPILCWRSPEKPLEWAIRFVPFSLEWQTERYKTWHRNGLGALTALRATGVVKPCRHLTVLKCKLNYEEAHEKSRTYKAQPRLMCSLCAWMSSWGPGSAERIAVALLCSREDNHSPGFRAAVWAISGPQSERGGRTAGLRGHAL